MRAAGYNTNLASEFHAMSVLYRLGCDAHLTLGNKKAVDIVVVRGPGDAVTLDVKAVVGKTDWLAGSPAATPRPRHFVALMTYDGKFSHISAVPRVWVLPHDVYLGLVKAATPPSKMRYLSRKQVIALSEYEDAWHLLSGEPCPEKRM